MAEKQDLELGEAGKGGGKKKLLLIIGAAVLVLAIGGAATFFLLKKDPASAKGDGTAQVEAGENGTDEDASADGEPSLRYVPLADAIVANLPSETKSRTIKVQVVFAVKSLAAEEVVKKHLPLLGSELLLLLSSTTAEQLMTSEGQQAFRDQALQNVNAVMAREAQNTKPASSEEAKDAAEEEQEQEQETAPAPKPIEKKPLIERILFTQFVMQ